MRVFVYEHLCAQQVAGSPLAGEGLAMLRAALDDLCVLDDVYVSTLVALSLFPTVRTISPGLVIHPAKETEDKAGFMGAARGCDFALVIAPEFDDVLATRCEWALEAGCRLLGPAPEAVRLCADKLRLAEYLGERGIPAPLTTPYPRLPEVSAGSWYVVKPRTGAGAQHTFLANSPDEAHGAAATAREQGFVGPLIAQPYVFGVKGSVAVIIGPGVRRALLPARQSFEDASFPRQFHYRGGSVRHPADLWEAAPLAERAAAAVPGLFGYVGMDLNLLGHRSNVIEINPRLTTSYVGLRRLSKINLMGVLLDVVRGVEPPPLSWRDACVRFDLDGAVHE